jgi:prepilin-type N-terminal cleavage/methylation domain-containing protein
MKEISATNQRGFSILEIIIALALMTTILVGAVQANISSQYWLLTSQIGTEALYKTKTLLETLKANAASDFQSASSTQQTKSQDLHDARDIACYAGGLCYFTQQIIGDISSCAKSVEASVSWRIGALYPTSTQSLYSNITNTNELIARGGDCTLTMPAGNWLQSTPQVVGSQILPPLFSSGIDVLNNFVYVVSSSSPQLRIYSVPHIAGENPILAGSLSTNKRLNALDVVRDIGTGRIYVYAMQHASTSQLAVFDVTNSTLPSLVTERSLSGVQSTGSFPQGWRVFVYGKRLYALSRETAGLELHIFNIENPRAPFEIVSAARDINRTVNKLVVREQKIGGVLRRYLFLAASSDLKELSIFDVTNDSPTEVIAINLTGTEDALSMSINGNTLYIGRRSAARPELLAFDIPRLISGNVSPVATSEVGADIHTIEAVGELLLLGTSKSGAEFQVWNKDSTTWSPTILNAGRISFTNIPHLTPHGIDIARDFIYLQSQSAIAPESLTVLSTP